MTFRPLPILSLCTVAALALLIGLGSWQARRAAWKTGLIRAYEHSRALPPARSLAEALCRTDTATPLIPFAVIGPAPKTTTHVRVFGRGPIGQPGWRHLSAITAPDCAGGDHQLLVETGFENARDGAITGVATLMANRWPRKSFVAAENNAPANQWYWLEAPAMAKALGIGADHLARGIYLASAGRRPNWLERTPPARHVAYSATWFMLAGAILAFYIVYHIKAGRLGVAP